MTNTIKQHRLVNAEPGELRKLCSGGFTLIELMIVIAIVAILVALAVPAYQDFTVRAKVAECVHGAGVPKVQISEYHNTLGNWPPAASDAGIEYTAAIFSGGLSQYCSIYYYNNSQGDFAVEVNMASISPDLASLSIIPVLSPVANASGGVDWFCTRGFTDTEALKYLPATCRAANIF
jgi:type IV pilus assembly protein PilA